MTAQTVVVTALMTVVFGFFVWAMLTAGVDLAGVGRHSVGDLTVDDVTLVALTVGAGGGGGGGATHVPAPVAVDNDLLPYRPPAVAHRVDDWTADLPTALIPTVVDAPRRTSPSAAAADWWPPIFTALADELGYDVVRGFDTGLVTA